MRLFRTIVLLCLCFCSACTTATLTAVPTATISAAVMPAVRTATISAAVMPAGYPAPAFADPLPGGYPAPGIVIPTLVQGTLSPDKGRVFGTIQLKGANMPGLQLYLSTVIVDSKGVEVAASLDRQSDPVANTDAQGRFNFPNVPKGRYVLMYYEHPQAFLLLNPETHMAIGVTVEPGKSIDLGVLNFNQLVQ